MCTIKLRRGENRYRNARAQTGMFMIVESVAEIESDRSDDRALENRKGDGVEKEETRGR